MPVQIQNLEELWTFNETMKYLRVSRATLYRWMKAGIIPAHKVGVSYRFYPSEVQQAIHGQSEQGEKP